MSDAVELMEHVKDADALHLPFGAALHIPQPFEAVGIPLHVTKFMAIELAVAVAMVAIFVPLARKISGGDPPRGRFWNLLEILVLFVRDQIARPAIGRRDADRFLPFLWTLFFFILFLNLAGLLPWLGSPTGALGVTGALAVIALAAVLGAGMKRNGLIGYWLGQVPRMELPLILALLLKPMIFFIEVLGLGIKHFVLAMRLFANMFAGHLVLAVIIGFIAATASSALWLAVMPSSVFGATAMNLLELLVAALQAYVFTFLAALFIGMAIHQH